jgi:hypothetical protein
VSQAVFKNQYCMCIILIHVVCVALAVSMLNASMLTPSMQSQTMLRTSPPLISADNLSPPYALEVLGSSSVLPLGPLF